MRWFNKPLGEVAEFIRGVTYKPEELVDNFSQNSVVCMRTKNVQEFLDQGDLLSIPERLVKRQEQFLQEGDLLVSTANSFNLVGKACWVGKLDYPATAGGFISILRPKVPELDRKFLYYWITSEPTQTSLRLCGRQTTNISNLSFDRAEQLQIPLPPLPTQKKIAAVLEKADELRRKREEQIKRLDDLLQATFLDMFGDPVTNPKGWSVINLGDITTKVTSGATPRGGQTSYLNEGILFIRSQNVLMQILDLSNVAFIGADVHEAMKRSTLANKDVLLNITGASIGRVCVYESSEEANVNQHVCLIRTDAQKLNPYFLSYHIGSANFQQKYIAMNAGATREAFNYEEIKNFKIMLPPLGIQNEFETFVKKTNTIRFRLTDALPEVLFNSLMQRAFKGELELK